MKYIIALASFVAGAMAGVCHAPVVATVVAPDATATPSVPVPAPTGYFGVTSARSASPIHLLPLTARGGKFYLGGPGPTSYCPVSQVGHACPAGNSTVFAGGDKTLSLGVLVPGGQQVYVAPGGALSYTVAHSAAIPEGSIVDKFSREAPTGSSGLGSLKFQNGFVACPAGEGQGYQVFGQVTQNGTFGADCLGFNALTTDLDQPGAWQY